MVLLGSKGGQDHRQEACTESMNVVDEGAQDTRHGQKHESDEGAAEAGAEEAVGQTDSEL